MNSAQQMEFVANEPWSEPPVVVSLGGGSGLSNIVRGERLELAGTVRTTAIIAESDDGGSSGDIGRIFDIVPPGDMRQALVALNDDPDTRWLLDARMDSTSNAATLMDRHQGLKAKLLTGASAASIDEARIEDILDEADRFGSMLPSLDNTPYGNLLIASATKLHDGKASLGMAALVGYFGIQNADIIPVTDRPHRLVLLRDGQPVEVGQSKIDQLSVGFDGLTVGYTYDMTGKAHEVRLAELETNPAALQALGRAAVVKSGVGSTLTSVLATTSAPGIRDSVAANGAAAIVATPNLILQKNEIAHAASWNMLAQIDRVADTLGRPDAAIVNSNHGMLRRLGHVPLSLSKAQVRELESGGTDVMEYDLVGFRDAEPTDALAAKRSPVVHRSEAVAAIVRDKVLSRVYSGAAS